MQEYSGSKQQQKWLETLGVRVSVSMFPETGLSPVLEYKLTLNFQLKMSQCEPQLCND